MRMTIKGGIMEDALNAVQTTEQPEAVMELYEDNWMIKSKGAAEVYMAAVLVPKDAMEEYEPVKGDIDKEEIGLPLDPVNDFINSRKKEYECWMEGDTFHIKDDYTHLRRGTIIPESVAGRMHNVPDLDHEVTFVTDVNFIFDFIDRADNVIGTDHWYIGAREEGIYLYSEGDNGTMDEFRPWDEFDSYDIDWSINNQARMGLHVPKDDHAVDTILNLGYTQLSGRISGDVARVKVGNHIPTSFIYGLEEEREDGMMVSVSQAPRIADDKGSGGIPDSAIQR